MGSPHRGPNRRSAAFPPGWQPALRWGLEFSTCRDRVRSAPSLSHAHRKLRDASPKLQSTSSVLDSRLKRLAAGKAACNNCVMATISEKLAIAIQHHQAGRLEAAEEIYREILVVAPDQPEALHLLGTIAHQMGQHKAAIEYIERAIRQKGGVPGFHNNLGEVYRAWAIFRKQSSATAGH